MVNDRGGLLHTPVELVAADTKGKATYLVSRALRLIEEEGVTALLGPGLVTHWRQLKITADMHHVPLVLTAGYRPMLRMKRRERSWVFSVYPDVASCAKVLFRHLARQKVRRIGLLVPTDEPYASAGLWVRAYAQERLFRVTVEKYGVNDADVRYQLAQFRKEGCQVVVAVGPRASGPMIAESFQGHDFPLAVFTPMLSDALLASAKGTGIRLLAVAPPLLLGESIPPTHPCAAPVMLFYRALGQELRSMSIEETLAAGMGWDAAFLVFQAISLAGSPVRSAVRNMIEGRPTPYYGVMGIFRPDVRNHSRQLNRWLTVLEWRGGGWRSPRWVGTPG